MSLCAVIRLPRRIMALTAVVAVVAGLLAVPGRAAADDPPDDSTSFYVQAIDLSGQVQSVEVKINTGTLDLGSNSVINTGSLGTGCYPTKGQTEAETLAAASYCMGTTGLPLTITNAGGIGYGTAPALQWIEAEARDFLQIAYDVPQDDRLSSYANAPIDSYISARLLDIVDKAAWDQPLTDNEKKALDWLQKTLGDNERAIANAAYAEWQKWENLKCAYTPPAPPAGIAAHPLPGEVKDWCLASRLRLSVYSIAPMPGADDFRTWGTFKVANQIGLARLGDPQAQDDTLRTVDEFKGVIGLGAAAAAAGGTFAFISGSSVGAAAATSVLAGLAPFAVREGTIAIVGGATAAALVAVLILATVAIIDAVQKLQNYTTVGPALSAAVAAANADSDPLGLAVLAQQNAGKQLREGMTADNLPPYRAGDLPLRLINILQSNVNVGHTGTIWADNAHDNFDLRFDLGQGQPPVDQISVPKPDGTRSTVWFSKKWMVEQTADGVKHPVLTLKYVDNSGKVSYASREGDHFRITTEQPDGTITASTGPMEFRGTVNNLVQAKVAPQAAPALGGVRPAAAGTLRPGFQIDLRPNPITSTGEFSTSFSGDYDFSWTLKRQATDGTWTQVPVSPVAFNGNLTYGARVTPQQPGLYRAQVTMTAKNNGADPASGWVDFIVQPPDLQLDQLKLVSSGANDVRVVMESTQNTPIAHDVTMKIAWPGDIDSSDPGATTSVTVPCTYDVAKPGQCQTQNTDVALGSDPRLRYTITGTSDLRQGVTVTVSSPFGGTVTRKLDFDLTTRPSFTAPPAPPADQVGGVDFAPFLTYVNLPVNVAGNNPNYQIATLVPASGETGTINVVDPVSNNTRAAVDLFAGTDKAGRYLVSVENNMLTLHAVPAASDAGSDTVPITVQQITSAGAKRTTMFITLDRVVAPDDKFRGGLLNTIDPNDLGVTQLPELFPTVVGGRTEWGDYSGQLCVGLDDDSGTDQHVCDSATALQNADFPYEKLYPHGVPGGRNVAAAWLPNPDEHNWEVPSTVTFYLPSDPPGISGVSWDGTQAHATFTPGVTTANSQPVDLDHVTCTLDGQLASSCFGIGGGSWNPGPLAAGPHVLVTRVYDKTGNFDTNSFSFVTDTPIKQAVPRRPGFWDNVVTIPDVDGVIYQDDSTHSPLSPGDLPITKNLSVTAVPAAGYVFPTDEPVHWSFTFTGTPPTPTLQSIAVVPAAASVAVGKTQAFGVTGHYSDGTDKPLTAGVTWSSSAPAVATVDPGSGAATGVKAGTATITATAGALTATATLTVTGVPACIGSFWDVPTNAAFCGEISWLVSAGITTGYQDTGHSLPGFHPTAAVSRQAMAAFLYRATNPGKTAPPCTRQQFWDVPVSSPFCAQISWLASTGITTGYSDSGHSLPGFHPTAAVSRQAMAAFLYRAANPGKTAPACTRQQFWDVPVPGSFCAEIAWLSTTGITTGYQDTGQSLPGFHPTAPVTRQAMAAFLYRASAADIIHIG